jgi:ABC-type uncharacterized transport system permease subunit
MHQSLMNPYFLLGVGLFGLSTILYLIALWQAPKAQAEIKTHYLPYANHSFLASSVFWSLLLACWGLRFLGEGMVRFFMGLAVIALFGFYKLILRRYQIAVVGVFFAFFSTIMAFASYSFTQPVMIEEGLGKIILSVHIILSILAITAFSISSFFSVFFLIQNKRLKEKKQLLLFQKKGDQLPSLDVIDDYSLKMLLLGFPAYTLSLLLGSAEAFKLGQIRFSYGIALGSWVIYAVLLQMRLLAGWRGKKANILTLLALLGLFLVLSQYAWRG